MRIQKFAHKFIAVMAVVTTTSLMTASTAFASPSTTAPASQTLAVIETLRAVNGQEATTDEMLIFVNDNLVWSGSLNDGEEENFNILVNVGDKLKLVEDDNTFGDDVIGVQRIPNFRTTLDFHGSGAHYQTLISCC